MRKVVKIRLAAAVVLTAVLFGVCGCRTINYYGQAIKGQYQILANQHVIDELIFDSRTPPKLRDQLRLVMELRAFAESQLDLPVDGHYRKYVDVKRRHVVYNIQAAPEFSLEPKQWWYPFLGKLDYRGYFSEADAKEYASILRDEGYDVYIGYVGAYSTLGFFKDPVLNTFVFDQEQDLAETLFHELSHQQVFASGDTDFNEAFATTVGEEGARRWIAARNDPDLAARYREQLARTRQWVGIVMEARRELLALYGDTLDEKGNVKATEAKSGVPHEQLEREKAQVFRRLRERYAELKQSWDGEGQFDAWFKRDLNNAQLNSIAAYYELVPGFERLLALNGNNLKKFYAEVERLSHMSQQQRHEWIRNLAKGANPSRATETLPTSLLYRGYSAAARTSR